MKTLALLELEIERLIAAQEIQPIAQFETELFRLAEAVKQCRKQFSSHPLPVKRSRRQR